MPGGSGTALSGYTNKVVAGGRTPIIVEGLANGSDFKAGYVVATDGETAANQDFDLATGDDADASASDGSVAGVLMEQEDVDLDTAFADNSAVKVVLIGSGTIVWVPLKTSAGATTPGTVIILADALAGHCGIRQESATPTVEENAINNKAYVGKAIDWTADVAAVRWIRVLI
jgi:hypothetical protein